MKFIILRGAVNNTNSSKGFSLRPVVSINLRQSGYELEKKSDDEGEIYFQLK